MDVGYAEDVGNLEDRPMSQKSAQEMQQNIGALETRMRVLEELVASLKSQLDEVIGQLAVLSRL
jgi:hypothetical protein